MLQLQDSAARRFTRGPRTFRRTVLVLGELLVTAGFIVFLFVLWQLWGTNMAADARQREMVREFSRNLADPAAAVAAPAVVDGRPTVAAEPATGTTLGVVYIPRFGADYARPLVQGTSPAILDALGIGHYEGTAMPGAVGNVAVAGHRQTHGAVLDNIDELVPGDRIYIQTRDGYYVYSFRNSEVVLPARTDVLLPVPAQPDAAATERYLTMTSCNPRFGSQERVIAYSVLERWQPASAGPPPAEIAGQVQRAAGED
ncbi:class E sortase [Arthrobacter sp. ES1]|uniref:class E sortase n=1 Tax=Arthrobacter sp. ES1 TaxID=1897056 RepID=UPI0037BE793A|nr:hypothetical protein [Arthrobacter sp. ES1]